MEVHRFNPVSFVLSNPSSCKWNLTPLLVFQTETAGTAPTEGEEVRPGEEAEEVLFITEFELDALGSCPQKSFE